MFRALTLRGSRGEINSGYRLAAALSSWTITRDAESRSWSLAARIEHADSYRLLQRPLQFTAHRHVKPTGIWCFEVRELTLKGATLTATLSPPLR